MMQYFSWNEFKVYRCNVCKHVDNMGKVKLCNSGLLQGHKMIVTFEYDNDSAPHFCPMDMHQRAPSKTRRGF